MISDVCFYSSTAMSGKQNTVDKAFKTHLENYKYEVYTKSNYQLKHLGSSIYGMSRVHSPRNPACPFSLWQKAMECAPHPVKIFFKEEENLGPRKQETNLVEMRHLTLREGKDSGQVSSKEETMQTRPNHPKGQREASSGRESGGLGINKKMINVEKN